MADLSGGLPTLDSVITAPTVSSAQAQANSAQDVLDRTILKSTIDNMQNQTVIIQQTQQQATKTFADIEAERLRLRQLQAKKAEAEALPRFVQRIGGLFDPEMNPDYLAGKVQESAGIIDDKAFQLQSMSQIADMQSKLYTNQLDMQKTQYGMLSDQVNRAMTLRKTIDEEAKYRTALSFQYSAEARAKAQEGRSVEQFARETQAWKVSRIDDSVLQKAAAGGDPNITVQEATAELQRRQQNALSLKTQVNQETRAATEFANQQTVFAQQQTAHQVMMLTEPELEAALQGKNPSIPVPLAKDERIRRDSQQASLEQIKNATEMQNINLVQARKLEFMNKVNPDELQTFVDAAKQGGGKTIIGGVEFTSRELAAGQATIIAENEAARKRVLDEINAQSTWKDNVNEADRLTLNAAEAQGDPKLIAQNRAMLSADLARIQNAVSLGAHKEAQAASEELLKKVRDRNEQIISTYPEAQRPFVRSRIEGQQPDSGQALSFIGVAGLNKYSLNRTTSGPYGEIFKVWSDAERGLLKGQGLPSNATEAQTATFLAQMMGGSQGQVKYDQLAAQVFSDGDFTGVFQDQRDMGAMNDALSKLSELNPVFNGLDIRNFTSQEVDKQTGLPTTVLQGTQLMAYLRQRWDQDVQKGFIKLHEPGPTGQPPVSYDQQLIQFMNSRAFQQTVYDKWTQGLDMKTYAFSELLHGGDPMTGYAGMIQVLNSNFKQYYAQYLQQRQQQVETTKHMQEMGLIPQGPNMQTAPAWTTKPLFGPGS